MNFSISGLSWECVTQGYWGEEIILSIGQNVESSHAWGSLARVLFQVTGSPCIAGVDSEIPEEGWVVPQK